MLKHSFALLSFSIILLLWLNQYADVKFFNLSLNYSLVPPSIADEVTNIFINKFSSTIIPCTTYGVPQPVVHWLKDGIRLPAVGESYKILSSGNFVLGSLHKKTGYEVGLFFAIKVTILLFTISYVNFVMGSLFVCSGK